MTQAGLREWSWGPGLDDAGQFLAAGAGLEIALRAECFAAGGE
ncbi:MAG: hypothetical protein ACE5O2_07490 [Armatimonadota bacterium]